MYCEKYRCTIPEKTCVLRQERHKKTWAQRNGRSKGDPGCKDCVQGKAIYKKYMEGKEMAEKTKQCAHCKQKKPATLEFFYKDRRSKSGLSSWCIACQDLRREEKAGVKKEPKKAANKPSLTGIPVPDDRQTLVLDFSQHEDLFADIKAAADEYFRTPELQVLWWLSNRDNPNRKE
jgi:hypothetical protein